MTLLEAVRATIRHLHDARRTEEAYVHWSTARCCRSRCPHSMDSNVRVGPSTSPPCSRVPT